MRLRSEDPLTSEPVRCVRSLNLYIMGSVMNDIVLLSNVTNWCAKLIFVLRTVLPLTTKSTQSNVHQESKHLVYIVHLPSV